MDINPLLFSTVIFILLLLIFGLLFYALIALRDPRRTQLLKRIDAYGYGEPYRDIDDIRRKRRVLSDVPFFNAFLTRIPGIFKLDDIVRQAKVPYPLGVFLLLTAVAGVTGFVVGYYFLQDRLFAALIALFSGAAPFFILQFKREARLNKFRKQFPESLDLIERALRAGHAFSSGMRMAAEEFEDPLGPEFKETLEEINFGVGTADALRHLAHRIDCPDLNFFVVAVILHQEIGGNLAEIVESISSLIRERFKFQDRVKALTAEGKLSAVTLILIPIFILIYLRFSSPDYINLLFTREVGRLMLGGASVMLVIGVFVMKRIINIRV